MSRFTNSEVICTTCVSEFLLRLRKYRHVLPKNVILTIRGQALSGDVDGAEKGLLTALRRIYDSGN